MREHAHNFGPDGALVGIVTQPAPELRRAGGPAILLANVGMHHRVGPYRLFVDLARRLAGLGFTTLRFDLSGLGDSATYAGGGTEEARWTEDMKSAMRLLEDKHGVGSFVVLGLCSGVDPAHAIALADPRIHGAVFVDGHSFSTRMHHVHRYVSRAANPRAWELFLKRRLPRLFGMKKQAELGPSLAFVRPPMPREQFVRELARLVDRRIALLFAFTGEQSDVFSHPGQFHDMVRPLDTRGCVDLAIYQRADHTFSMPEDRRAFVNTMARWIAERFPIEDAEPTSTQEAPVVSTASVGARQSADAAPSSRIQRAG